jgi:hypothetical protein
MRTHLIQPREPFGPPERVEELREVWRRSDGLFTTATHPAGRPTFSDLFTLCRPGEINVIANADIFFDAKGVSLISLYFDARADEARYKTCLALSRWDVKPDGTSALWNHADSQDVFIVYGQITVDAPFTMGVPGVDNRLCHILKEQGLNVINPAKSIKAYHLHNVQWRSYLANPDGSPRGGDKIERLGPPHHRVQPTSL